MQQILSRLRLKSDGLQLECLWGKALSLLIAVMRLSLIGGRSREIRTPDPLVPTQMRYQTALHSVRPGDGEIHASGSRRNSKWVV